MVETLNTALAEDTANGVPDALANVKAGFSALAPGSAEIRNAALGLAMKRDLGLTDIEFTKAMNEVLASVSPGNLAASKASAASLMSASTAGSLANTPESYELSSDKAIALELSREGRSTETEQDVVRLQAAVRARTEQGIAQGKTDKEIQADIAGMPGVTAATADIAKAAMQEGLDKEKFNILSANREEPKEQTQAQPTSLAALMWGEPEKPITEKPANPFAEVAHLLNGIASPELLAMNAPQANLLNVNASAPAAPGDRPVGMIRTI